MSKIKINSNVCVNRIESQKYIIESNTGKYYKLNSIGDFIIDRISNGREENDIVKELCSKFPEKNNVCVKGEVHSFIVNLINKNIIFNEET